MVKYGDLMNIVDTENRWVYKGSVTTPPCAEIVYWNVVRKIYPVKQKHLDLFKKQLQRGNNLLTGYDLEKLGNWRVTQPIKGQDLHIVQRTHSMVKDQLTGLFIFLIIASLLCIFSAVYCNKQYKTVYGEVIEF